MSTYGPATDETRDLLSNLLLTYADDYPRGQEEPGMYQEIMDAKVRIDLLMAHGDRDDDGNLVGNAITHQGQPAAGLFKIRNLELRAAGLGDCQIMLDHDWWDKHGERQRIALLDHELFHLDFKRDKAGIVARDDLRRPLIKVRPHTFEVGWHAAIALRHGLASPG